MSSRSFLLRLFSSESYFLFSSSAIILFLSLVLQNAIHSTPQPLYQFVPTVPFIIYAQTSFEPSEATTVNTLSLSPSAPPFFSYTHARVIVLSLRNNHTLSLAQISESPTARNRNKLLRESGCSVAAAAAAAKQSSHTHTAHHFSAHRRLFSFSLISVPAQLQPTFNAAI